MSNDDRNGIIPFQIWPKQVRIEYDNLRKLKDQACKLAMQWKDRRDMLLRQCDKMDDLIGRTNGPWGVHPEDGRKILTAETLVDHADEELLKETMKAIEMAYKKGEKMPWE